MNFLKFKREKLSAESLSDLVISPSCGAVSVFIGTKNCFENKNVVLLEDGAYEKMALEAITGLCQDIRNQWKSVENIAIYHRLGTVPVKEASVIIAISSPHRVDAIKATEWCIEQLKTLVPLWKKEELYEEDLKEFKENKESLPLIPKSKKSRLSLKQEAEVPYIAPHLIQIKATNEEIDKRMETFIDRKRNEINVKNIAEFCSGDRSSEFICARIDSTMKKQTDSKGHLQVDRVLNSYYHRDQFSSEYLTKYIPPNGVEERLQNLDSQLTLKTPVPINIYRRLKLLEDRMLQLESISPEYIQFWDKTNAKMTKSAEKKKFSIEEIDSFIKELEKDL